MVADTVLTPEEIDAVLDGVLRASGSSLRNYTMKKSLDDMRGAMRAAERAVLQSPEVQRLRESLLLSSAALQAIIKARTSANEWGEIIVEGKAITIREILNMADKALERPWPRPR